MTLIACLLVGTRLSVCLLADVFELLVFSISTMADSAPSVLLLTKIGLSYSFPASVSRTVDSKTLILGVLSETSLMDMWGLILPILESIPVTSA